MGIGLEGVDGVLAKLNALLEQVPGMTAEGVHNAAIDIGSRASERAPVESGDLRGNCNTDDVTIEEDVVTANISFNLPYAARQHEHVEYKHPLGGEAKYLERAALEKAEEVRIMTAKALKKLFGG